LVTRHLFQQEGLHRVEANTCNPAFVRCDEKLGWTQEGRLRERFLCGKERVDYLWMGLLKRDFKTIPAYEPTDGQ
jgi:RimJ/RimL family protein N-acetyltransferase